MRPPPVLPDDSEPICQSTKELVEELAGPGHLLHQPRRLREVEGTNGAHSGWVAGTRLVPGRKLVSQADPRKSNKIGKTSTGA